MKYGYYIFMTLGISGAVVATWLQVTTEGYDLAYLLLSLTSGALFGQSLALHRHDRKMDRILIESIKRIEAAHVNRCDNDGNLRM